MLFICGFCVSLREVIYWVVDVLIVIFFIKSQIFFLICIRIYLRNEGYPDWIEVGLRVLIVEAKIFLLLIFFSKIWPLVCRFTSPLYIVTVKNLPSR